MMISQDDSGDLDRCVEAVVGWRRSNKLKLNPDQIRVTAKGLLLRTIRLLLCYNLKNGKKRGKGE